MDIYESRAKKRLMEKDILKAVSAIVGDFKKETEFSPNSIYISMVNVTHIGQVSQEFIVDDVSSDIQIL
jgi:hypothetical protein